MTTRWPERPQDASNEIGGSRVPEVIWSQVVDREAELLAEAVERLRQAHVV